MLVVETIARDPAGVFRQGEADQGDRAGREGLAQHGAQGDPFAGDGVLRAHLDHRHHQPDLRRMAVRLRRRQDDHRAPRSSDAPLRDHRDRKRLLALQESVLKATDPPAARSPRWAHRNLPRAVRRQPRGGRVRPARGAPPMDYLYDLRRASPKGSTLHADRGSMFNAD